MVAAQTRMVRVQDGRLETQVLTAGAGPPVVFLHGASGLQWDDFLGALAARFTVYAPYHPGAGGSTGVEHLEHLWDLVLYYYDLFDALGLAAPAIIGHSFGGMVAAELAATDQSRVSRLVLINAIGLWRDDQPVGDWMAMTPRQLARLTYVDPEAPAVRPRWQPPEDPAARTEWQIARLSALAATGKFIWPIPERGLHKRLHRIQCPTLVLWGQRDGLVPPVYAEEFGRRIRGARVEILPDAAHAPHVEQLARALELVSGFLTA
jgi:pimeloyl-ACP methyl ester carboxylesterase